MGKLAVFVAEIGDVYRFAGPAHLCSWAGLTPTHRESDTVVRCGHITKQGSKLVRWAAVEAIQRQLDTTKIALDRKRIEARRGRNIAKIAAARKLVPATTGCATDTSAPWPTVRWRREHSDAARARPLNSLTPGSRHCLTPGSRRGRRFD